MRQVGQWGLPMRVHNTHIVVDFGDRPDGGSRRPAGVLLLDADGGRQTVDVVHFGRLQAAQELACIGAERFDVSPLTFGVNRVDGETALPASAGSGADGHLATRDIDADVLEVVLASRR